MKRQTVQVTALLVGIVLVCTALTVAFRPSQPAPTGLRVTASFYPLYTVALQVVGETEGVSVSCLTAPTAGCLHDYQLSPDEMTRLSQTDLLLLNGAGMEDFLNHALAAHPSVKTADTSAGLSLLDGDGHHGHAGHEHHENAHVWLSPALYARQVEAVRDALCEVDPRNAAAYTQNAAAYLAAIAAVEEQFSVAARDGWETVLFHDSVAYPARDLHLTVAASLPLSENTALSAHALTEVANAVRGKRVILLYDEQYADVSVSLDRYAAETRRVVWDTAVTPKDGVADRDRWLWAMEHNISEVTVS